MNFNSILSRYITLTRTVDILESQRNLRDSLYLMLKEQGMINGAGAYLYIGDHSDKKFAQKNFKSKLYEDPDFRNIFIDECITVLHNSLNKQQLEVLEQNRSNAISSDILHRINPSMG